MASVKTPRVVLMLSESWTMIEPRDLRALVELAPVAEQAGIDGVLLGERISHGMKAAEIGVAPNPRDWLGGRNQVVRYPHPSPLHVLSAMAPLTTTLRLVASALLTPFRHPLVLGKELATLDLMSRGRLVVMPIPGAHAQEYEALDRPFHQRGELLDEQLEVWHRAWRDDMVSFHGRHYDIDTMSFEPKPWRPTGPAMWIGGRRLHARALRRLVRHGSGYFPQSSPDEAELERLASALTAAGRSLAELELVAFIGMTTPFSDATSPKPLAPALDAAIADLARGMTTFVIKPSQYIDDPQLLGDFCRDVVTGLRARMPT
jgi:alkanesulfonate monooxygenase SsuD/methylene tetrahydromethanopterin reductase-like flavin-dependent oxidoreductase (luciferase family)